MRPRLDRPYRPFRPRCLILGMVAAWIVALYLPALLLAVSGTTGSGSPLAAAWALADRVDIAVKAAFALLSTLLLLGARKALPGAKSSRLLMDAALGAVAILLLLAFLPEAWSRGFGIGLTGARFAPVPLACYLAGGALAGLTFSLADAKCGELEKSSSRT